MAVASPSPKATTTLSITARYIAPHTCIARIDAETFTMAQDDPSMTAKLRRLRRTWTHAVIVGDPAVPYCCIGGLIYRAQQAGFERIEYVPALPPQ